MLFRSFARDFLGLRLGDNEDEFAPVRGIAALALAGAGLLAAISLVLIALVIPDLSRVFGALPAWREALAGDSGVAALAETQDLKGLAAVWRLSFWLSLLWLGVTSAISGMIGFHNERDQGWSEMTWMSGLAILCLCLYATTRSGGLAGLDWHATFFLFNGSIETDRKSTRLNSSHIPLSRMPSSA